MFLPVPDFFFPLIQENFGSLSNSAVGATIPLDNLFLTQRLISPEKFWEFRG